MPYICKKGGFRTPTDFQTKDLSDCTGVDQVLYVLEEFNEEVNIPSLQSYEYMVSGEMTKSWHGAQE